MEEKLKQYADLKNHIKELTTQAKELEPEIKEHTIENATNGSLETDFGKFILSDRRSLVYTDDDVKKSYAKELKIYKEEKEEEAVENGEAEVIIKKTLMYKA